MVVGTTDAVTVATCTAVGAVDGAAGTACMGAVAPDVYEGGLGADEVKARLRVGQTVHRVGTI